MLEVRLLGKFEIKSDGKPVPLPSRPAQSLFAYLILSAGTAHRREKLAGMLWPDSLEETARGNLRHAMWRMRKALPSKPKTEYLLVDDLSIAFNASSEYRLDAERLVKLSQDASVDELITVLSGYQGELLPGFYDEWVVIEREHLHSIFEHHIARLVALLQNENRWLDILEWSERWIKLGQKPEPAYRALMTAHAAKGDMSKVAATYERCVNSLKELGVEPSEQTRTLFERLKAGKEVLESVSTVPVKEKHKEPPKTNLPIPLTSFIGREREIEEVKQLLSTTRLLTLTGTGGIGKTRLAIQAAKDLATSYKDGVCWVELAPLIDEALVPQAVVQVLGVRESPDRPPIESLKNFLREKQLLLILDNCEHLIAACAQLVHHLLTYCENLRILTTSREALGITGETTMHVPALSFPALSNLSQLHNLREFESVQLFAERAAAVHPELALTQVNAFMVTQICYRLDGIPLALELAAARAKILSLEEIAKRLDDRFTLLIQGSRTALPRHQTLRATIDWSYDLLSEPERLLFSRLSIFAGGFTLDGAEEVASGGVVSKTQVIDLLGLLINKSLIFMQARSEEDQFETRYGMLETIREYAREKLNESGETERLRQFHRDFFVTLAERAEPKLKSAEQLAWLDRLEAEHDNLRAAWDCSIESDPELALRLASALLDFWLMRGNPSEGRLWLTQLLEQTNHWGQTAKHAHAFAIAGWSAYMQSDYAAARPLLEEAVRIARISGDQREIAFALQWLGWMLAMNKYDNQSAQVFLEECLAIYQGLQDEWGIAMVMSHLAGCAHIQGRNAKAEERGMKSLAKFQELGDKYRAANVLDSLGGIWQALGDYERASTFYGQTAEMHRELRSGGINLAQLSLNLAWVSLHIGEYPKAKESLVESLKLFEQYGSKGYMVECLGGFAGLLAMSGKPEKSVVLFGAEECLFEGMRWRMDPPDEKEFDHYVAVVRGQLDEAAFAKAWEEGRAMTLEEAIEFARNETQI